MYKVNKWIVQLCYWTNKRFIWGFSWRFSWIFICLLIQEVASQHYFKRCEGTVSNQGNQSNSHFRFAVSPFPLVSLGAAHATAVNTNINALGFPKRCSPFTSSLYYLKNCCWCDIFQVNYYVTLCNTMLGRLFEAHQMAHRGHAWVKVLLRACQTQADPAKT